LALAFPAVAHAARAAGAHEALMLPMQLPINSLLAPEGREAYMSQCVAEGVGCFAPDRAMPIAELAFWGEDPREKDEERLTLCAQPEFFRANAMCDFRRCPCNERRECYESSELGGRGHPAVQRRRAVCSAVLAGDLQLVADEVGRRPEPPGGASRRWDDGGFDVESMLRLSKINAISAVCRCEACPNNFAEAPAAEECERMYEGEVWAWLRAELQEEYSW